MLTKEEFQEKLKVMYDDLKKLEKHDFFIDPKDQKQGEEYAPIVTIILTDKNSAYENISVKIKLLFDEKFSETSEYNIKIIGYYVPEGYQPDDNDWFDKYMKIINKIIEMRLVIALTEETINNYDNLPIDQ